MKKKLAQILVFIQYSILGLMSGLLFTIFSGAADNQGLAAGGIIVFNALFGMILGIVMAVISVTKLKTISVSNTNKVLTILNFIAFLILMLIIKSNV